MGHALCVLSRQRLRSHEGLRSAVHDPRACLFLIPSRSSNYILSIQYIDLCGAFAGAVFDQTCAGVAPNCSAMVPDPANYPNAYWDISYLRTFSTYVFNFTFSPSVSTITLPASPNSNSQHMLLHRVANRSPAHFYFCLSVGTLRRPARLVHRVPPAAAVTAAVPARTPTATAVAVLALLATQASATSQ